MSITSRINEMSSHIEQAYDELQGLGADLTNVNKNIENISMVLDDIYDSMPQVSGEGTSLTLDDTRVGKIKSTLKGNTSQTTYSGKNLVKVTNGNSSRNNTTLTIQDNVINFKTTGDTTYVAYGIDDTIRNANYGNYVTWNNMTLSAGTYTLSTKYLSGSTTTTGVEGNFIRCVVYGRTVGSTDGVSTELSRTLVTNSSNSNTFTTSQDMEVNIVIYMYANQTPTVNINFQVQLEKGSSATSFEPYVGGTPSPNPSYPQPVNVVSGDNEINVCGKNLWYDIPDRYSHQGVTLTKADDGGYVLNGTTTGVAIFNFNLPVPIEQGTYVLSINASANIPNNVFLRARDSNMAMVTPQSQVQGNNTTSNSSSFTCTTDIYTLALNLTTSGVTYNNLKIYPMIEKGSTASEYSPYQGNTYNIDLPVENLVDTLATNSVIVGSGLTYSRSEDGTISVSGTSTRAYDYTLTTSYTFKAGETYTFYCERGGTINVNYYMLFNANNGGQLTFNASNSTPITRTMVEDQTIPVKWSLGNNTQVDYSVRFMIQKGSKVNSYTPYGTTPIELCRIGNYQDYFYKDSGKWYLHKEIGKVVLDGTEAWAYNSSGEYFYINDFITNFVTWSGNPSTNGTCDKYLCASGWFVKNKQFSYGIGLVSGGQIAIRNIDYTDATNFKSNLSSNNVTVYYQLETPTNTEITYQPLIDQLNLLEKAMSKDGQTNISQVNNDLPFIISASALKEWQESTSLNSTLSMANPLSLGNTLNTQEIENNIQPIEVDNIEPLEEEENEES